MSVYKQQRCRNRKCYLKDEIEKPKAEKDETVNGEKRKTAGPCRLCGDSTYYSKEWYFNLYHKGQKKPVKGGLHKQMAEDKERQMLLDRSSGKLEKKALTWDHGVAALRATYLIVQSCPNGHTEPVIGKPEKPGICHCGEQTKYIYRGLAKDTVRMYEQCLKVLTPYFKRVHLHEIDTATIKQYKLHRYGMGVGPASVNQDLATISKVLNLSGMESIEIEKDKVAKRSRYLKPEEFVAFMKAVASPVEKKQLRKYVSMYSMFSFIVLDTGLRKTAALSLKKGDLDFNIGIVKKIGKGKKESTVKLTRRLTNALNIYFEAWEITNDDQYLFPSPFRPGEPLKDIRRTHDRIMTLAGIKGVTRHDLRRTFGAYFTDTTGDLKTLQFLLGHSSIDITNDHYSPFLDGKTAGRMEEFEEGTSHLWNNKEVKEIPDEDLEKKFEEWAKKKGYILQEGRIG